MTTISIIGSGNMATTIGTRAVRHGHTVELMGRNTAKVQALADQIGSGATVGTFGTRPAGDIVFVAVLYTGAVEVVTRYGDALAGMQGGNEFGGAAVFVVEMQAEGWRFDVEVVEQLLGLAGIFAGDAVGLAQDAQRAEGDVF